MDFHAAWHLARLMARLRPDVVHAHDPHGVALAALALSLGKGPRPKLVASRRVDFPLKHNAFSRWKYRQVDGFICASALIHSMLVADGIPPDRVVTVHEGVDLQHVAAAPALDIRTELWFPTHAAIVGNVAALVPHKGQRHLIDAAALVIREVPDARFLIAGEGELRPALERQVRTLALEKHVVLTGFRPDVLSLIKSFDLFVMSSVTEGLGTSLLDAMACGLPIVATRAGGIPEVVADGETGRLVPPRDHQAMAEAIVALIEDEPGRKAMGRAGLERVKSRFSADRMVRETLAVYERLAGMRPAADTASRAAGD